MKISIACDGSKISGHFGHCEGFKIYEVEGTEVRSEQFVENPGHKPGFLPKFLSERKINTIIVGGMGARAQELFRDENIDVIVGAQGEERKVLDNYLDGALKSSGSVCTAHEHEGNCGE